MATDGPPTTLLRVRHLIAENLAVAVVVCLLLAGAGGFVAYEEDAAPDTRTEQRTVATWTTDSQFTHSATVQRSTRAFDEGEVLRSRSAYLLGVTPELNATHVYRHEGDAGAATVETNVTLVKRAVDPAADESVEYWRVTDRIAGQETTIAPGETATIQFSIDVPRQRNETREIEADLGGTPGRVQLYAVVTTRVETTLAGEQRERTRTDRLSIQPGGTTYGVETNTSGEQIAEVTESTAVPIESNTLRIYGGSLFALLWLGAAAGLVWADREDRLAVPEETIAAMQVERARQRFDEWISVGTVPEPTDDDALVRVHSLEDLVDVAIDSDRRVIDDADADRYVVIVERTWYVYEPDNESPDSPSNGSGTDADTATDSETADVAVDGTVSGRSSVEPDDE